jgi:glycosyltransferase involved in cell wall biosynthesis
MEEYEVIIVSDGSTDNTPEIVAAHDDPRIRFLEKENGGQASARNLGIVASSGAYISLCDDDDLIYPDHFATLSRCLEKHKDAGLVYSDALWTYPNGSGSSKVAFSQDFDKKSLENYNYITTQTVMFRRSCLGNTGLFNEDPRLRNGLEDWEFLLRFSDHFPFLHIKKVTGEYRIHEGNSFHAGSGYDYSSAFLFVRTRRFRYLISAFGPSLFDHVDHMYPFHLVQCHMNVGEFDEACNQAFHLASLYKDYCKKWNGNPVSGPVILFSLGISHVAAGRTKDAEGFFSGIITDSHYRPIKTHFDSFITQYAEKTPDPELKALLSDCFLTGG